MRIFKLELFSKWARKEKLTDSLLRQAVLEMERGLIGATLGGHVYKKRISLPGRGKRGSTRSIIAYLTANRAFFIFGYAKNDKANISHKENKIARSLATELLSYSDEQLDQLVIKTKLIEVNYDG